MYLVDTSVWIAYFRQTDNAAVGYFKKIMEQGLAFGVTSIIYQEILQGSVSKQEFNVLVEYLSTQRFYHPKDVQLSYEAAAGIYFYGRQKGMTIRSSIDCLIAQIAIEYDLLLLHNDKDYVQIHKIMPNLKLVNLE